MVFELVYLESQSAETLKFNQHKNKTQWQKFINSRTGIAEVA